MPFDNPPEQHLPIELILLRLARSSIDQPNKWAKRCFFDGRGGNRYCAFEAIRIACDGLGISLQKRLVRALAREIPLGFHATICFLPAKAKVIIYNDSKQTTHEMVMRMYDRAIARLEPVPA